MTSRSVPAVVLLLLVSAVAACSSSDSEREARTPPAAGPTTESAEPAVSPASVAPRPRPTGLARLPQGPPTAIAYTAGGRLHVGARAFPLPPGRVDLVTGASFVLARERRGGAVTAYDARTGATTVVADGSRGLPVTFPGDPGRAALLRPGATATVDVVERVGRGARARWRVVDSQDLPVACCDDEPRLVGVTQFREVVVESGDGAWVWSTDEGQEGVAHLVPDTDDAIAALPTGRGFRVAQVTSNEIVLRREPTRTDPRKAATYDVQAPPISGQPDAGRFRFQLAVFDPGALRAAQLYLSSGRVTVVRLDSGEETRLRYAPGVGTNGFQWERPGRLLLDVADRHGRMLIRCAARTGSCERVAGLDRRSVVAG